MTQLHQGKSHRYLDCRDAIPCTMHTCYTTFSHLTFTDFLSNNQAWHLQPVLTGTLVPGGNTQDKKDRMQRQVTVKKQQPLLQKTDKHLTTFTTSNGEVTSSATKIIGKSGEASFTNVSIQCEKSNSVKSSNSVERAPGILWLPRLIPRDGY